MLIGVLKHFILSSNNKLLVLGYVPLGFSSCSFVIVNNSFGRQCCRVHCYVNVNKTDPYGVYTSVHYVSFGMVF
jgi:hypothetical protein